MPDIKLKNASGVERVYTGVDTITVPLADGTGNYVYGLTDEELTLTGDISHTLDRIPLIAQKYGDRMTIMPIKYASSLPDQSNITITLNSPCDFSQAFLSGVAKLPTIIGDDKALRWTNDILSSALVSDADALRFIKSFDRIVSKIANNSSGYIGPFPARGDSFRNIDEILAHWHQLINNEAKNEYPTGSTKLEFSIGNSPSFDNVDAINNVPLIINTDLVKPLISNIFNSCYGFFRAKNFTFATDNGVPYKQNWKSQILDFSTKSGSSTVGWYSSNYSGYVANSGINPDKKNICDAYDSYTTLEGSQARYQTLKDDPDSFAASSKTITYNGTSGVYVASLFSRYNHDSAVNTINSLPDTSEYLAANGGTNTIKFLGIAGAETDGGAINTLTDAEIAVATAKGWTVTLV